MKKTKNQLETEIAGSDSCFRMIREKLEALGIEMDACPPLFYPEAIHNLFVWTVKASWECWGRHAWHGEVEPGEKVAQCIHEAIVRRQASDPARKASP